MATAKMQEEDNYYEIENIVDIRKNCNRLEFKVKWVGYSQNECTWEPMCSFNNKSDIYPYLPEIRKTIKELNIHPVKKFKKQNYLAEFENRFIKKLKLTKTHSHSKKETPQKRCLRNKIHSSSKAESSPIKLESSFLAKEEPIKSSILEKRQSPYVKSTPNKSAQTTGIKALKQGSKSRASKDITEKNVKANKKKIVLKKTFPTKKASQIASPVKKITLHKTPIKSAEEISQNSCDNISNSRDTLNEHEESFNDQSKELKSEQLEEENLTQPSNPQVLDEEIIDHPLYRHEYKYGIDSDEPASYLLNMNDQIVIMPNSLQYDAMRKQYTFKVIIGGNEYVHDWEYLLSEYPEDAQHAINHVFLAYHKINEIIQKK